MVVVAVVVVEVVLVPGAGTAATACGTNSLMTSVALTCGHVFGPSARVTLLTS